MTNAIAFPGLNIGPFYLHESFQVGELSIHWYGVMIAIGILAAYLFCSHIAKDYDLTKDNLMDMILYGLPSAIIFARIYYVIFEWDSYQNNLSDVFKVWEGGIAIYGAVIGACLSTYFYCRIKKVPIMHAFDVGAFGLLIGQIFGRWGNFINAEAYGGITDLPWRMALIDIGISVHPTFLYESIWNLGIFLLLNFVRKKTSFSGEIFLGYIILYGAGRFWIEGLRTDSLYFGPVRISQLIAAICVIFGIMIYSVIKYKKRCDI